MDCIIWIPLLQRQFVVLAALDFEMSPLMIDSDHQLKRSVR